MRRAGVITHQPRCPPATLPARPPRCENVGPMVDLHLHLLPGVDDGPRDDAAAVALADALLADGVSLAIATPHVNERFRNTPATIERAAELVAGPLLERGLKLKTGAEVSLERFADLSDDDLIALSLAGTGRYLLVECPHAAWPLDFELHVTRLDSLGMTTVIAHPERCAAVQADAAPLRRLVQRGALVQVVAGSLVGEAGSGARKAARELIAAGDAHIIASDAHGVRRRPPKMRKARAEVKDEALAEWLTELMPRAIADGVDPPPRPTGTADGRSAATGGLGSALRRLGGRKLAR